MADVTNLEQVERMHATVFDAFGGVDLLVANAGGSQGEMIPFLELEPHVWQRMIDRNLTSVYYCSLVCARQMAINGGQGDDGNIIATSARSPDPAWATRRRQGRSAPTGQGHCCRSCATWDPRECDCSRPDTHAGSPAMFERPDVAEANRRTIPLGRVADPQEMVGAVVYLASEEASFTTGTTIFVDGGYTIL